MNSIIKVYVWYTRKDSKLFCESYYYYNVYAIDDPLKSFHEAHAYENVRVERYELYYLKVTSFVWEQVPDDKQIPFQTFK